MIEDVQPERCICEACSDISPDWEDIRTKFGHTMLATRKTTAQPEIAQNQLQDIVSK